jgi:hypothetical protein
MRAKITQVNMVKCGTSHMETTDYDVNELTESEVMLGSMKDMWWQWPASQ